jgi:hypothetical protein
VNEMSGSSLGVLGIIAMILVVDSFIILTYNNIGGIINTEEYGAEVGIGANVITSIQEFPILSSFFTILNIVGVIAIVIILRGGTG